MSLLLWIVLVLTLGGMSLFKLEFSPDWDCWIILDTTERLHFHFSLSCIGEGNGNPLQCSCLENPSDGGAWWAAVYGVAQSRTRLSDWTEDGKESACNVGDLGSILGSGRSPGERNCNPLQYPCLENSMDRGVWQATVHGIAKSQTWPSD